MKKIRKILALAMAMCMIFSMTTIAFAEEAAGTADDPKTFIYQGSTVEITVPAGETVYYQFAGSLDITGCKLEISGSWDVSVLYGRQTLYPQPNGKISVELNPMGTSFAIVNAGEEDAVLEADLAKEAVGTMNNPYIMLEAEYHFAELEAGNNGYFINYTVPEDGTLSVTLDGAYDAEDNSIGWQYCVNNLTTTKYSDTHWSDDEDVVATETLEVSAGDEIQIIVSTYDPEGMPPAGRVAVWVDFKPPVGSEDNPILVLDTTEEHTISADSTVYFQAYFAGMIMKIENSDVSVIYGEDTYEAVNGVITVEFPPSMSVGRPMPELFQIVNDGTEDVELEIVATYPEGHMENPKEIEAGSYVAEFSATSNGVFYTWTAAEAGKLTVTMTSETGWTYVVNNMTTSKYGDNHSYDDEDAVASETITVAKGDEITIAISAINEDGMPEDGDVAFKVEFTADKVEDNTVIDSSTTKDPEVDNNSPDTEDAELEEKVDGSVSDKDASLDVSAPSTEAVSKVEAAGKDILKDKKFEILELDLFKNGIKLTELKDKIKVTLSVFDDIKDAKWVAVYRLDADKLTHLGTVEVKDGKFTFETDHFSTYVFAAAEADDTVKPGDTSDNAPIAVMVALAATAAFAAVAISKKRAEEN